MPDPKTVREAAPWLDEDARRPPVFPPPFASTWGDDEFGLYADIRMGGLVEQRLQRFRWLEPGTFWMGSEEGGAEVPGREGPRHLVTISKGFWMAETTCTQMLWQAVMGGNPSRFDDDSLNPVENVSWVEVRSFISELNRQIPDLNADLPTEAEWEYGCRSGTETAFAFGEHALPDEVNFDGNFPLADGPSGEYRERPVRTGSLRPNLWGLYEMHGNVDEWCKDGLREYGGLPIVDPVGVTTGEFSPCVRGGSWINSAGNCRSAVRYAFSPGNRDDSLGFRLCLRSIG